MAEALTDRARRLLDVFWSSETSCAPDDFERPGVVVVTRPADNGSDYVQLFRRLRRLQITCSPSLEDTVRAALLAEETDVIFDRAFLERTLTDRVDRIIGPAYLGYRDADWGEPWPDGVLLLEPGDLPVLGELRSQVTARDWEYSGLDEDQPIAGCFHHGRLVAAAGYKLWGGDFGENGQVRIAHVGVVTHPEARGRGAATACVRAISSHAIANGLIAQYQTLLDNAPAMAVARRLGFEDYAERIYVRAHSPQPRGVLSLHDRVVLGLAAGAARLEPPSPRWSQLFLEEKDRIANALGELALDIQHIGSTAVPGLDAKPILDIAVALRQLTDAELCVAPLETIGYRHQGYRSEQMGHVFEKVSDRGRTHCIHALDVNDPHYRDYLLMRDYLSAVPEARRDYQELKRTLAERFPTDRRAYTAGKADFIRQLLKAARARQ